MKANLLVDFAVLFVAAACMAADEITVNTTVKLASGNVSQSQLSGDVKLDMTNASPLFVGGVAAVTTTKSALPVGSVNAPGFLWAKNTATNFYDSATNLILVSVDVGPTNEAGAMVPTIRLMEGEVMTAPLAPGAALYFQGNTNTQGVQYFLITR